MMHIVIYPELSALLQLLFPWLGVGLLSDQEFAGSKLATVLGILLRRTKALELKL